MKQTRQIDQRIIEHQHIYQQALVLLGARQVGKTTLLRRLFPQATYLLVDEKPIYDTLETYSSATYKQIIGASKQILIDEIHLLSDPGRAVKLIYDQLPDIRIMVTGSSVLHIKNKTGESMAGRSIFYHLYPLTFSEYLYQSEITSPIETTILDKILTQNTETTAKIYDQKAIVDNLLIYGLYPNTVTLPHDRVYLENLAQTAIFKDIIELDLIENRSKAYELLQLLAYQIGNLISYGEIGTKIGLNSRTVQRYIEIFEQSFILYRLYPFSQNKRNEIGKTPKIYFWDVGLRNALIQNFDPVRIRPDTGVLFENFIINEVQKLIAYQNLDYHVNYWRLKSGTEVDLVLSNKDRVIGCEIKYGQGNLTSAFSDRYPDALTHVVTAENFH